MEFFNFCTDLGEERQVGVRVGLVGVRVGGVDGGRARRDVLPAPATPPPAHAQAAHDPAARAASASAVMVVGPVQFVGGAPVGA